MRLFIERNMGEGAVIEDFYGVYLLYCRNPRYSGRTYIGYTMDPNRRIKQHNRGKQAGGAWKTSNKGPWDMVLIVHGFPNDISALRFEWAWQHPETSRRLKHLPRKVAREKTFVYNLRILSCMLHTGPWDRLPLTLRWFHPEYQDKWPTGKNPPLHMPVVYGKVKPKRVTAPIESQVELEAKCYICKNDVQTESLVKCLVPSCNMKSHMICLSKHFLEKSERIVPVEGKCPECKISLLWGDIIRKRKGCYTELDAASDEDSADDWTQQLTQI